MNELTFIEGNDYSEGYYHGYIKGKKDGIKKDTGAK